MDNSIDLLMNNSILYRCTQKYYDQQLSAYSLGYGQAVYLTMINEHEGITMKELAQSGSFDKGTITKAITKLEKMGYVRLEDNPKDKRSKLLYTTEASKDIISKMYLIRKEWWEHLIGDMPRELSDSVIDVMKQMVSKAQDYTDIDIKTRFYKMKKLSLTDYPHKLCTTLYTGGCNMKCPYCNQTDLVFLNESMKEIENYDIYNHLSQRESLIEGVCITGGEPLIQEDIVETIKEIKKMGYKIKLDTNGTYPERLIELIENNLIDFVSLDIKNSPDHYSETCGLDSLDLSPINKSIDYLLENHIDYEIKTVVIKEYHTSQTIEKIGQWIQGASSYCLYYYQDNGSDLHQESLDVMNNYKNILEQYVKHVEIRGERNV